jgi:hypothetical protein
MKNLIKELVELNYQVFELNNEYSICETKDGFNEEVGRLIKDDNDIVYYMPTGTIVNSVEDVVKEIQTAKSSPVSITSRLTNTVSKEVVNRYTKSINVSNLFYKENTDSVMFIKGDEVVSSDNTLESIVDVTNMRTIELLMCISPSLPLLKKIKDTDCYKDFKQELISVLENLLETLK